QAQRQLWIEDRPIRQQARRHNDLLFGCRRRDDRDRCYLRSRARSRRCQQQRKTLSLGKSHAADVIATIRCFCEISDELRRIERTSTADGSNKFYSVLSAKFDCLLNDV